MTTSHMAIQRRNLVPFDPNNSEHVDAFFKFHRTMAWGPSGCPFELHDPYRSVPAQCADMIITKLAANSVPTNR